MNLKKIIKESLDEFDWIRDTEPSSPHVPYSGMKFKIKDAEETSGVIYTISDITDTHMIINWIDPSDGEYRENFKWPLKHYFGFVDKGDVEIVYENLNESENDFAWITDVPLNPWLEYDAIIFDKKPKKKKLNNYIELALNTKNPSNKESWETGRKEDIESIVRYTKKYGEAVLMVDGYNNLVYADPSYYDSKTINSIKYSQLVNKNLNESEEGGDFDWINDIEEREIKFKKGDRVRIHNMGDKDAFINWLGMYGNRYLNGDYGKNIEGTVSEGEDSMNEFSIVNITGGHKRDEIYFPYQRKMEIVKGKHHYTGLNLIYEPI
jgi:hypothetical protein